MKLATPRLRLRPVRCQKLLQRLPVPWPWCSRASSAAPMAWHSGALQFVAVLTHHRWALPRMCQSSAGTRRDFVASQATMAAQALAHRASPFALRKLKCVTVDVTGTLIAYKGLLGDYYCMAAKAAGLPCPDYDRMHAGFKVAYTDMATKYPCFGNAVRMPNVDWWRTVVRNSFLEAGYEYDNEIFDQVFKRIYAMFGSGAPYIIYNDAQPFLRWARKQGLVVGVVSNAEFRYRDVILPTLGLHQGSEWDFGVFSGIVGFEKPDPRIFEIALQKAGGVAPDQALHIGDSLRKDYLPARSLGMHALLIDRFQTPEHRAAREAGVPVFPELSYAHKFIMALQEKAEAALMI